MTRSPLPTERTMLQGVALARWGTWVWLAAAALLQRSQLVHPALAVVLVAGSGAWAVATTALLRVRPGVLLQRGWASAELVLAWVLLWGDGVVFEAGHTTGASENLAGEWPLVAILAVATSSSPTIAGVGAFVVASGRLFGALANGEPSPTGARLVSFLATAVFYSVSGVVWALVTRRLRVVETEVASRRARDDVARTLHDGVLQTLALVARRTSSSDPELAATARASDRDLRAWLYGGRSEERQGFDAELRRAADRVAAGYDLAVTVNVVAEREPDDAVATAVVGAVGEALANAAKHAEATRVVVYAEVDERGAVFASVRDDGRGCDPVAARGAGRGIVRSIDERLDIVGGRAELVSTVGQGTEVRVWA